MRLRSIALVVTVAGCMPVPCYQPLTQTTQFPCRLVGSLDEHRAFSERYSSTSTRSWGYQSPTAKSSDETKSYYDKKQSENEYNKALNRAVNRAENRTINRELGVDGTHVHRHLHGKPE